MKRFWPQIVVIVLSILAFRTLIGSGYFNMHDDLQMMRQLEMEKCFKDLQIPCRWVPDMGFGYGFPLFNYYPPLPYLTGEVVRIFGFSFVDTVKILFALGFVASGLAMYFLAREFFGELGAVLASAFYIWAPYHSVDVFVRGAMNESWALIWFPAILLFSYKLITNKKSSLSANYYLLIALSLSWTGLLLSHNLMVMIFTPVFAVWCLILLIKVKSFNKIPQLLVSGIFAFGLAAFFTLPVFLEQNLVHTDTLIAGYYEYTAHFATIKQLLFSRFWGYGPSIWGDKDGMSFQVGQMHWILSFVTLSLFAIKIVKSKNKKIEIKNSILVIFFIMVGIFAIFMTHNKSTPLWVRFTLIKFVQFPWRFLTLVILSFSFAIGSLVTFFKNKKTKYIVVGGLIFTLVAFNWTYFEVQNGKLGPLTDQQKFSGTAWELQRTAGIYDYLPKSARFNPRDGQMGIAEVLKGKADIKNPLEATNHQEFTVIASESSVIRINTYFYPSWKVFVDGKETKIEVPEGEEWGRMYITVSKGTHDITARLYNTWPRTVGNIISLVSWAILGFVMLKSSRWQISTKRST
ncbi:hypothetical protein HYS03_01680 [Candidatus Woesebacteria bacterium]|nr:hypothetical protein [Candidatus Woesebacteria bacterium]QQG47029.1 MAG: hypothetical protein HY044_02720 [Candidatus Woesebacteria bacterium]